MKYLKNEDMEQLATPAFHGMLQTTFVAHLEEVEKKVIQRIAETCPTVFSTHSALDCLRGRASEVMCKLHKERHYPSDVELVAIEKSHLEVVK